MAQYWSTAILVFFVGVQKPTVAVVWVLLVSFNLLQIASVTLKVNCQVTGFVIQNSIQCILTASQKQNNNFEFGLPVAQVTQASVCVTYGCHNMSKYRKHMGRSLGMEIFQKIKLTTFLSANFFPQYKNFLIISVTRFVSYILICIKENKYLLPLFSDFLLPFS